MMCVLTEMSGLLLLLAGPANLLSGSIPQPINPVVASAQARPIGGVQLDMEPRRAQVFVDGRYAGVVDDFRGYYRHLVLPAGMHRIEVFTPGYVPLIFDVAVVPARTITYRQSLQEAPGDRSYAIWAVRVVE